MTTPIPDFDAMTDEEIDAWTPETTAETAEATDTPAEATPEPAPVQDTPEAEAPEAPGGDQDQAAAEAETHQRAVPIPEHIAMRQRAQAAEAELARLKAEAAQREAEAQARAEQQRLNAEYQRILNEDGEDAAERFRLSMVEQGQRAQQQRAEMEQRAATERIALSEQFAKEQYGEEAYQGALVKLADRLGAEAVFAMASRQPNPAKWVWETAQTLMTPEERQAAINAEAERLAAEKVKQALSKNAPPAPRAASSGVAHVNSGPEIPFEDLDPDDMSDAQLAAFDRESRRTLYG